jgi:metal-responsive CopG/Arc/MetJ family transcriptional regulator
METIKVPQQKSVAAMTRLKTDLNDRVETLIQDRGYRNKSSFIEEAVRNYVLLLEKQNGHSEPVFAKN